MFSVHKRPSPKRGASVVGNKKGIDAASMEDVLALREALETYIEETPYPTLAHFCYKNKKSKKFILENPNYFGDLVERLNLKREMVLEQKLLRDKNPTGAIFALKSQMGWDEKHSLQVSGGLNAQITVKFVPLENAGETISVEEGEAEGRGKSCKN